MNIKEMLGKKKALDPDMKDAKLKVLKEMRKIASDSMADDLGGHLSKVTVAGKSPEDVEEGLDVAKSLMEETPDLEDMEEMVGEDLDDDDEEGEDEEHRMKVLATPEDIDAKIAELMEKKKALMMKA